MTIGALSAFTTGGLLATLFVSHIFGAVSQSVDIDITTTTEI
jgi:hypothetical protein